ncbi:MAG: DUF7916 family protein [Candidatus Asgardarchaeia archaeon]
MVRRIISASPREVLSMSKEELINSIKISEGRTVMTEVIVRGSPLVDGVSNVELAATFGSDIILLDTYDPKNPMIPGLPSKEGHGDYDLKEVRVNLGRGWTLKEVEELVGRPIGVILGAVPESIKDRFLSYYGDVFATRESALSAFKSGARLISITGWGVDLSKYAREIVKEVGDYVIVTAGRGHGSGLIQHKSSYGKKLITLDEIEKLAEAEVDVIDVPCPGAYPGWTVDYASEVVDRIHEMGCMAASYLTTSQESSDIQTIKILAIKSKMTGADIHVLGDGGFSNSIIPPENIMEFSISIKGRRHTYKKMATSINR